MGNPPPEIYQDLYLSVLLTIRTRFYNEEFIYSELRPPTYLVRNGTRQ